MLLQRTGVRLKLAHHTAASYTPRVAERRSISYHPKVRAFPFAIDPEHAKKRVNFLAAATSFVPVSRTFRALLGSLGLQADVVQPKRMQAVYLPAWFIDGMVGAKEKLQIEGGKLVALPKSMALRLERSYMPGFSIEPLSRMGFADLGELGVHETVVPWSEDLSKQHDQDIQCLPYTLTPLVLDHVARSNASKYSTAFEGLTLDPSSVVVSDLTVAYPVLIPVYLMQYEAIPFGLPEYEFTLVVEAARPDGIVYAENTLRDVQQVAKDHFGGSALFDLPEDLVAQDFFKIMPYFDDSTSFCRAKRSRQLTRERMREVVAWLEDKVSQRGAMQYCETMQEIRGLTVDMDHLLIQDLGESAGYSRYLAAEEHCYMTWTTFENLKKDLKKLHPTMNVDAPSDEKRAPTPGMRPLGQATEQVFTLLPRAVKKARKLREELKPAWRKQWEEQPTAEWIARRQQRFPRAP